MTYRTTDLRQQPGVCTVCLGDRRGLYAHGCWYKCDACKGTGQQPAQPNWREFTDTQRLDWLMDNCGMPQVSRSVIDEAIARDEFFRSKT